MPSSFSDLSKNALYRKTTSEGFAQRCFLEVAKHKDVSQALQTIPYQAKEDIKKVGSFHFVGLYVGQLRYL
jgi:hypothetical protein